MLQTPSAIGCNAPRHSRHTGRREMLVRALPQRRQSEGKKTEKKLSAITRAQPRCSSNQPVLKAIGGLATAALAWLARILSSLLLKTASVLPREDSAGRSCNCCHQYNGRTWARQRCDPALRSRLDLSSSLPPTVHSPARIPDDNPAGSIPRSAPGAKGKSATKTVRKRCGGAIGKQSHCRNRRNEIGYSLESTTRQGSFQSHYTSVFRA
jgi:hypothetical protein